MKSENAAFPVSIDASTPDVGRLRRKLLFSIPPVCFAMASPSWAQNSASSRTYAATSLVGDHLSVVFYEPQVGSSLDPNRRRDSLDVPDAAFDRPALVIIEQTMKQFSSRPLVFYQSSSPDMFADQDRWFDGSKAVLPDVFKAGFARDQVTHLILLTKYRGEARLKTNHGAIGSGKLDGLGFYVNRTMSMTRSDTGERSVGFLAPFVYVRISLIDVIANQVLRSEVITKTMTLSAARNREGVDPWGVLSPTEKVKILNDMLDVELRRTLPELLRV